MATRTPRLLLRAVRTLAGIAAALSLLLQTGCSSVFFYPDQVTYVTPDRLNLDYQDVYIETPDGETLHGWWLPAASDPKGTVYFLHGNAQNISSHIMNVAWLPDRRYNVFIIDYRGYGRSTGAPDIEGTLHDAESGLRWLTNQPDVENQPLFLLGQSLGGALGTALASEWVKQDVQPPLDGVILDGTFNGFRAIAREKLGEFWLTWPFQIPLSLTVTDEYEAYERISDISPVPVMVIHSERDGIIPFHHGEELFEAAKEPKRFLRTDTGHGATFVIPGYQAALLGFMDANGDEEGE
ncbi:MAG: alpha/beta hydrolase [Marinobacter sp.]